MPNWAEDAVFYHIYPLGLCDAPPRNDFNAPVTPRLEQLHGWLDHLKNLGVNALYLGPLFESSTHGYDTADYYRVDRRLGSNQTLSELSEALHQKGIRLVLDAVFNHVGRDFWAFRDVQEKGPHSPYCDWFYRLDFSQRSPRGDAFSYEAWEGHYDLVKLNVLNPQVREHLFGAVAQWITDYKIDGLRLDAADQIDIGFLQELAAFCKNIRPDFWLMGEIIHGDYRRWANHETLDSVTNYECYKGLYSSHNDRNYFEIAYSLNRQFGPDGIYRHLSLYNFADNHDVNRVASTLRNKAHLYPLYALLFTMPGIPSLYYGSEWGLEGKKAGGDDRPLRPALDLASMTESGQTELVKTIGQLAQIRLDSPALRYGSYQQLMVTNQQLSFSRMTPEEVIIVVVNSDNNEVTLELNLTAPDGSHLVDLLNEGETFPVHNGKARIEKVWPEWARIMRLKLP
ncbi:MAG TPA: alpha-amylase family glycosyl hydrolase [Chloroflexia bacterium]|nr:alpha-amylase family glycosyl hydrolase [Chloroflexia bacterium]